MAHHRDHQYQFLTDPWGQAIAVGLATTVPVRKYPGWLQFTLGWGSAAGVAAMVATPGATTRVLRKLAEWSGEDPERIETVDVSVPTRAALAAAAGAATYGGWKLSVWTDTATENVVRVLRVPAPRIAMGLAAGWATWYQVTRDNQRKSLKRKH